MNHSKDYPILVVDDDVSITNLIKSILIKNGYGVLTAEDGLDAYTLIEKRYSKLGNPAILLVISDWKMPNWEGVKLLSELKSKVYYSNIPFILMSGVANRQELHTATKNKADGMLMKPIDQNSLINKIKLIVNNYKDKNQ